MVLSMSDKEPKVAGLKLPNARHPSLSTRFYKTTDFFFLQQFLIGVFSKDNSKNKNKPTIKTMHTNKRTNKQNKTKTT